MTPQEILKAMFDRMVVAKDPSQIERFYDPEFLLTTNGQTQDYAAFEAGHRTVYATEIRYQIEYDDEAWVQSEDRIGGRMWITTTRPGEEPTRIEVVLVGTFRDGRLHRIWELTWPDWSQLKAFETY